MQHVRNLVDLCSGANVTCDATENLASTLLLDRPSGLSKAVFVNSGSKASDAATSGSSLRRSTRIREDCRTNEASSQKSRAVMETLPGVWEFRCSVPRVCFPTTTSGSGGSRL